VSVSFADIIPESSDTGLTTTIEFPSEILAGYDTQGVVRVTNLGSVSIDTLDVSIQSAPFDVAIVSEQQGMPPFSSRSFPFTLPTKDYLASGRGRIIAMVNGQTMSKEFSIRPAYLLLVPGGLIVFILAVALLKFLPRRQSGLPQSANRET